MFEIIETDEFTDWLEGLGDRSAVHRILARLRRARLGNLGDVAPVGEGVYEMRIFHGPGYRVYFVREGRAIVIVLTGGDKGSQRKDIARAKELAKQRRK